MDGTWLSATLWCLLFVVSVGKPLEKELTPIEPAMAGVVEGSSFGEKIVVAFEAPHRSTVEEEMEESPRHNVIDDAAPPVEPQKDTALEVAFPVALEVQQGVNLPQNSPEEKGWPRFHHVVMKYIVFVQRLGPEAADDHFHNPSEESDHTVNHSASSAFLTHLRDFLLRHQLAIKAFFLVFSVAFLAFLLVGMVKTCVFFSDDLGSNFVLLEGEPMKVPLEHKPTTRSANTC